MDNSNKTVLREHDIATPCPSLNVQALNNTIPLDTISTYSVTPATGQRGYKQLLTPPDKGYATHTSSATSRALPDTGVNISIPDTGVSVNDVFDQQVWTPDAYELHTWNNICDPGGHQSPPTHAEGTNHNAENNQANIRTYMRIYDVVRSSGIPNYRCARIPLPHSLNMARWRSYLQDYHDTDLCDFLQYGWPMNYTLDTPPTPTSRNHRSALDHPFHVAKYIDSEIQYGALLGPFMGSPFHPSCQISPLMTREKKWSDKRRIILDLSWPPNASVNWGIPKDTYLGQPYKLRLPTVDDAVNMIRAHGQGCYLYSLDLERAYRQLRSDPLDWPLLGIQWDNDVYIDVSIPFGIRWGAMACSRTTSAICYIHNLDNYASICFIDDFFGVSPPSLEKATDGFKRLRCILGELGVKESIDKAVAPTTRMTWIGIDFDTIEMIMRVPESHINDTLTIILGWASRQSATRQQLQQLLGKLFFISHCVKPARLFVSRMLATLRAAPMTGTIMLDEEFKKDLLWFNRFLPEYNGVHLIDSPTGHEAVELDSCLSGCGAIYGQEYYHTTFPDSILRQRRPICHLEMLNIVVAVKTWALQWQHKIVTIYCDNSPAINVLTSGRGRDCFLLQCAREIWLISAKYDITITPVHKPGSEMILADALSRVHLRPGFKKLVDNLDANKRINVNLESFDLIADI